MNNYNEKKIVCTKIVVIDNTLIERKNDQNALNFQKKVVFWFRALMILKIIKNCNLNFNAKKFFSTWFFVLYYFETFLYQTSSVNCIKVTKLEFW